MADNQQQPINNPAASPLENLPGNNNTYDLQQSLSIIANALQTNPNAFNSLGLGRRAPTESQSNYSENKWKFDSERGKPQRHRSGNILADFEAGIKDQLLDSLARGNFRKGIQGALDTFVKEFGVDIRDLPAEAGRALTKQALNAFNNSKVGKEIRSEAVKYGNKALDAVFKHASDKGAADAAKAGIKNVIDSFRSGGAAGAEAAGGAASGVGSLASGAGSLLGGAGTAGGGAAGAMMSGTALAGLAEAALVALPPLLAIAAALLLLSPALEGIVEMIMALGKSFNREEEQRKRMLENAKKRQEADFRYLAEQPFKILQEAVEKWTSTWDANLSTIGQTQGYDKEAVYALYEGYADRLRNEDLSSVIKATDVVEKLSSVLNSGLTGKAAEEFAYVATKLNAAIPNQDFFSYVDTYASIAANAIAQGKTEADALAEANQQLESFASNLLYSSRELAGGFATGLKNSSDLFNNAVKIAQTAKTYNASAISGTLTSVSAIIGAVAPDLASSLVDNVVQAAIGGNNNSSLVALRSLAGVNAGNTEFLRALAENPKAIFSTLFSNLAELQNMSPDNYMEVAEGLADVFGIDKGAFARVDFNYLADAISAMSINSNSLEENLSLLQSGQTTTSAEQLKAQEINSVILEEGLAYVIDSEAGRMIQEHMWDEQRDNAIMANEYAVSLQGAALEALEGIRKTITNILNFMNPAGFVLKGITNMAQTLVEAIGNEQDIKEILELGAVGGNQTAFHNLTTRGKNLNLTTSLIEMMGGSKGTFLSRYLNGSTMVNFADIYNQKIANASSTMGAEFLSPGLGLAVGLMNAITGSEAGRNSSVSISSRYNWGTVGKSLARAIQSSTMNSNTISSVSRVATDAATQAAQESSNRRFQEFIDTAKEAAKTMTYEQWVATSKSKGISDFEAALESYGRTEAELRNYFEQNEALAGAEIEAARKNDEQLFRDQNRNFWDYESGTTGIFETSLWLPFFGDGRKYDTRMDAVDNALTTIQSQLGNNSTHTVISGIEEMSRKLGEDKEFTVIGALTQIQKDINSTFVTTSSMFQQCLRAWVQYIADSKRYTETISKSTAWGDLQAAEKDQQTQATLALANALGVFSANELEKMDPQLQTNVLLGEIVVLLQTIMQQNNTQAGGLSLIDTISALGLGLTK